MIGHKGMLSVLCIIFILTW